DRPGSGRPEEPLVVLRVAPRDRFVEGSGLIPEKLSADQERARVGLHPAPRHQIGEVEPIPRGYPRERAVPGLYEQAAGGHVGGRIAGERANLHAQLARVPGVVIVTEREELAGRSSEAGVAGTGRPAS